MNTADEERLHGLRGGSEDAGDLPDALDEAVCSRAAQESRAEPEFGGPDATPSVIQEPAGLWAVVAATDHDPRYRAPDGGEHYFVKVPMPIVDDLVTPLWQLVGSESGHAWDQVVGGRDVRVVRDGLPESAPPT